MDINHEALNAMAAKAKQLHSEPRVALKVLDITSELDFEIDAVISCLETDPALAAKILSVVNSSRYNLGNKVSNLRQAVTMIGQRSLRMIAMTFSLVDLFTKGAPKELFDSYWRRSLTMAMTTIHLGSQKKLSDVDDAYAASLLSDIGFLLLAQVETDHYTTLHQQFVHGEELIAVELEEFGFHHAMLSKKLLQNWNLPEPLVEAVGSHHTDEAGDSIQIAVRAGDYLAEVLWTPLSTQVAAARNWFEKHYQMDIDAFTDLVLGCKETVQVELAALNLEAPESIDCEALRKQADQQFHGDALEAALELDSLTAIIEDQVS